MKDDILNQNAHQRVKDTNEQLIDLGYKSQAFSRPINFFYLDDFRRRIISDGENFSVLDSDIKFTKQEILSEIDHYPERFSPNVIMRPIYQEVILPNIAYLGGPAEIIYWLQLKGVFDYYKMSFPVLMPRNFGMIINQTTAKKAKKLGIADEQLFRSKQQLKTDYLSRTSTHQPSLNDQKQSFSELFETIKIKAELIDQSLGGYIGSEQVKAIKALEHIEKKLKKSLEKNHQTALTQIEGIKDRLFPNGVLQERSENYLNFYFNNTALIQELLDEFEPFKFSFYLFWEE
jgi:bacillithiol biosynthesis cysteine-adding enzyme BshC